MQDFSQFFDTWLSQKPFGSDFHEKISYLLTNRGKMLRPALVLHVAEDLKEKKISHHWLALSIELHHNYTLVHDDLPCMDDDDIRRGKPTLHKMYGEANALLVGDILLAQSYALLANIENVDIGKVLKLYYYATGAKGLILGQKIDLDHSLHDFLPSAIMRMYELKTARLFQLSLVGSILLTTRFTDFQFIKNVTKLGSVCGILFQLLDDYQDWHSDKKTDFNFFRKDESAAFMELKKYQERFQFLKLELKDELPLTLDYLSTFLKSS